MASITFSVSMTDGSSTQYVAAVSDADAGRVVGWAMAYYPTELDAAGLPIEKTTQWAIKRWVEAVISSSFAKIAAYELQQATAAVSVPPPIAVTLK